jgi:hypothetical protein
MVGVARSDAIVSIVVDHFGRPYIQLATQQRTVAVSRLGSSQRKIRRTTFGPDHVND